MTAAAVIPIIVWAISQKSSLESWTRLGISTRLYCSTPGSMMFSIVWRSIILRSPQTISTKWLFREIKISLLISWPIWTWLKTIPKAWKTFYKMSKTWTSKFKTSSPTYQSTNNKTLTPASTGPSPFPIHLSHSPILTDPYKQTLLPVISAKMHYPTNSLL